ncbi:MAG: anaerobic ribonucleoside-triphosphate reductase [Nitrososphaeria archaeon]
MERLSQNPLETEKYQTPHDILVRTTDGYLVKWERAKIVASLIRETELASHMTGLPGIKREEAEEIAKRVESRVKKMGVSLVSAPLIRELVNNVLIELSGREKRFLVYRNFYARVGAPVYDSYQIDLGLGFEAKENANLQPNPESSHKKKADRMCKEQYLLMMPPEIADAHLRGDMHIHDLEYFGTRSFCMDHDLRYFLYYGFMPDGTGHRASVAKPARHAEVAILHSVKVLAAAQTNFSGGQGFFNYLVFLAPYTRGLNEREVEQLMQMMFYELTQSYVSRGGQLVFSNIQVQPGVPEIWRDKPVVARGKVGPDVYGDYEDEVSALFRALHKVALEGDAWGKPFNFPKMEEQLAPEFLTSRYEDAWLLVHRAAARHGIPYFDNLTPAYRGYGKGVSCYQCCAYCFTDTPENDENFEAKMHFEDGAHFSMGGWQVVSLNLPRAAYLARGDDEELLQRINDQVDVAVRVFQLKKQWMNKMIALGRIPFVTQRPLDPSNGGKAPPLVDAESLVYTVGLVGVNEMVQHHAGAQLHESRDALKLALKTLIGVKEHVEERAKETSLNLGMARTPAESTAQSFAVADLMSDEFREMSRKNVKGDVERSINVLDGVRDLPVFYSNGTHLYVGADVTLAEKIEAEQKFFPLLDGGNMFHVWLGEAYSGPEALYKVTRKIAATNIGYFAYTKDLTICGSCDATTSGIAEACPMCGSNKVTVWSRITGYYQDVSGWNEGKLSELRLRRRMGA